MGLFMQLKHAKDVDSAVVGLLAKERSVALENIAQPFSLILTSTLIHKLCSSAGLEPYFSRLPEGLEEQVNMFGEVVELLRKVRPETSVIENLRESFELVTLDTSDLKSLAQLPNQKSVLGIIPSPSYACAQAQGQRLFISGDTFDTYYEQLKVAIASFFTPQAIQFRLQNAIREWHVAALVFRLPNVHSCFEVHRTGNESSVKTYVGLPDIRNAVEKDEFTIGGTIPTILTRNIKQQNTVCVYALDQNQVVAKQYVSSTTAMQSAPDYDVLEASRLAKKFLTESKQEVFALFAKPKQGTLVLLDMWYPLVQRPVVEESSLDKKLALSQEVQEHVPQLHQAIKDDDNHKAHSLIQTIKEKLDALLHHK